MRLLVLGGTAFLSRAVVEHAVAGGHEVVAACRAASGTVPEGAEHRRFDRADPDWSVLAGRWDAVVDIGRRPAWVRDAVTHLDSSHWVFVSTISVYADHSRPGGPGTVPVLEAAGADADEEDPQLYGELKVACEEALAATASSSIVRPGLIVGPGDPSGRFTYWVERLAGAADGEPVLAPAPAGAPVQVIDVRDLAAWIVLLAAEQRPGLWNAVGETMPLAAMLDAVARGVGTQPTYEWVDPDFLLEHEVPPWMGDGSLPLWLPGDTHLGMMRHDPAPALADGLSLRPIEDTAADTLAWELTERDAVRRGLTRDRERELLAAWRS